MFLGFNRVIFALKNVLIKLLKSLSPVSVTYFGRKHLVVKKSIVDLWF